jgi:hypothetical protein
MLDNWLKIWSKLAPDELKIKEPGEYVLLKTANWDIYPETVLIYNSFFEEAYTVDTLQGYIQRCIEARGWGWNTGNYCGFNPICSGSEIWVSAEKKITIEGQCRIPPFRSLLAAYLTAIASQRPITQGPWKHADGDVYESIDFASLLESDKIDPFHADSD